jgi:alkanesulfonate monooxygenase SsuD/methylene tetrahydromethanopterin reductase-like flavin-dependent oxidoreductase (luciferase family)
VTIRVGLTLPSFVDDPEIPIAVARAAEDAELDGVFVYDHLWRGDHPNRRPALECFAMLGALAAETRRVHIGPLVARATLRPAATLANSFATVQRVSGGRLIAAIGAGDSLSRHENEAYGLAFGSMVDRVNELHAAVRAAAKHDYPVWIGGRAAPVLQMVSVADGWNSWGTDPVRFEREAAIVRQIAPHAVLTWGGLARPLEEGAVALAERLQPYVDRGATWIILGPIDSGNPANAAVVGELRARLVAR